jgi:hypothetical protein
MMLATYPDLVPKLRMLGAVLLLFHMSSCYSDYLNRRATLPFYLNDIHKKFYLAGVSLQCSST